MLYRPEPGPESLNHLDHLSMDALAQGYCDCLMRLEALDLEQWSGDFFPDELPYEIERVTALKSALGTEMRRRVSLQVAKSQPPLPIADF